MKYVLEYTQLNESREEIVNLCKKYRIREYSINRDGSIDAVGTVNLSDLGLKRLPLTFRRVDGNFLCNDNQLTTLEGAPEEVEGNFLCSDNQLTTLEGAPRRVGGAFQCNRNTLTTLEGAPEEVGGFFTCMDNDLTTLNGVSRRIGRHLVCDGNRITTLEGAPDEIGGTFICGSGNPISTVAGHQLKADQIKRFIDIGVVKGETLFWEELETFCREEGMEVPDRSKIDNVYDIKSSQIDFLFGDF